MSRRLFIFALFIVVGLSVTVWPRQHLQSATLLPRNQTVPTRTPTSAPAPTEPPSDGGGSPSSTPTPANMPATATATQLPGTLAATVEGAFVATAVPCGGQPTVQALNTTFVRRGPGGDYDVFSTLVYLEVRPIVGRAADAAWWLIELSTGERGWVADNVVDVQGYTAVIPIAVSPPIGETSATPTPGTPWHPTPLPTCTVTPTPTALPTLTASAPAATATATLLAEESTPVPTATASPTARPPTATATVVALAVAEAGSADSTPQATVAPLNVEAATGTSNLLPIAAVLLLAAGIAVILVRRRRKLAE